MRLTVGQALVRFLANQYTERDGIQRRLVAGCSGIFGHGNVAGVGQALLEARDVMPYRQARNEQGMVHTAVGYARINRRLSTLACTTSIGPGATNMVTGAALATINRLPVLLLPSDIFSTRVAEPVLQQLELPGAGDMSVNDAFRPVSRYFDRVWRPQMLVPAALQAMRVLADPAETGAVTLALPQDVQAEAHDFPDQFFARRVWHVPRPSPEPSALARAVELIRSAARPLIVAGGGIAYSDATAALRSFVDATGIPVAETQAGKGSLAFDHPACLGAVGVTGTAAANAVAREADLVIGIGTRWTDFTTASHSGFADPGVRFVNVNIAAFDAAKLAGTAICADAREALNALAEGLAGWRVPDSYRDAVTARATASLTAAGARCRDTGDGSPLTQTQVIAAVNEAAEPGAVPGSVVVNAAGSMPGDLHALWRAADPLEYHVEYGYSCMGYEIAGGLGVKLGDPRREVFVMVGDGSYLMLAQELVTAIQERAKLIVVLVENHGFASIGALSESVGSARFGTSYRFRDVESRQLDGDLLPVDLAANAASLGAHVVTVTTPAGLRTALAAARQARHTTVIHVRTDPIATGPAATAWWDVPVAEVSSLESTRRARAGYEHARREQRPYL